MRDLNDIASIWDTDVAWVLYATAAGVCCTPESGYRWESAYKQRIFHGFCGTRELSIGLAVDQKSNKKGHLSAEVVHVEEILFSFFSNFENDNILVGIISII